MGKIQNRHIPRRAGKMTQRTGIAVLTALLLVVLWTPCVLAMEFGDSYVTDDAGILTQTECDLLNDTAADIAARTGFGLYIAVTEDYRDYTSSDVETFASGVYRDNALGIGPGREGLLLLLSMADRDYALYAYGYGNTAFTDAGKIYLAEEFLDDFRNNDWYSGFMDYLTAAETYVLQAQDGSPVDDYSDGYGPDDIPYAPEDIPPAHRSLSIFNLLMLTGIPCLISGLICMGLKSRMHTVRKASGAGSYVRNFRLRERSDIFTHATESRVKIEREHHDNNRGGGGGTTISGGTTIRSDGGSSSSGKF